VSFSFSPPHGTSWDIGLHGLSHTHHTGSSAPRKHMKPPPRAEAAAPSETHKLARHRGLPDAVIDWKHLRLRAPPRKLYQPRSLASLASLASRSPRIAVPTDLGLQHGAAEVLAREAVDEAPGHSHRRRAGLQTARQRCVLERSSSTRRRPPTPRQAGSTDGKRGLSEPPAKERKGCCKRAADTAGDKKTIEMTCARPSPANHRE
jgi:hypothetical protein